MADWVAIENAISAWVRAASGYAAGQVIWAEQSPTGTRPTGSIITMRLGDIAEVTGLDELQENTNLSRPAGQEVELRAKGFKKFTIGLQAYGTSTTGNATGRSVLSACQTSLSLPSIRDALGAVNIAPMDYGTVQNVTAINHTLFESRAVCDFQFYVLDEYTELTGYIATVQTVSYLGDPLGTRDNIDIP